MVIQTLWEIPTRPLNVLWDLPLEYNSLCFSKSCSVWHFISVQFIMHLISSNSPLKTSGKYCLICSLEGHVGRLSNIKYKKLTHVIIISDTTFSEILNLTARSRTNRPSLKRVKNSQSSSIGCNFLQYPTLLLGNSFYIPPSLGNWFPMLIKSLLSRT